MRVPFVALCELEPTESALRSIADRAWQAQVPIVLHAGAVPGLPGVCYKHTKFQRLNFRIPEIQSHMCQKYVLFVLFRNKKIMKNRQQN